MEKSSPLRPPAALFPMYNPIINIGGYHHPQLYNSYYPTAPATYFLPYSKRKGGQIRFTTQQTKDLENKFIHKKYLSAEDRKEISTKLNLSDRQVKTWFQNRRAKWRRLNNVSNNINFNSIHTNNNINNDNDISIDFENNIESNQLKTIAENHTNIVKK